ncbi:MAG: hypothetical protein LBE02_03145 [Spirochaetaceae bacterium]|jgi:hypothetical protein|nr:hypothetical protein [Spirochaetaceae bacterium]
MPRGPVSLQFRTCRWFLGFFLLGKISLFGQTGEEGTQNTVYVIRAVEYRITGKTRPHALNRVLNPRPGKILPSLEALEGYIAEKTRELHNIRALEAGESFISYTLGERESDGRIPVDLEVFAFDSGNFIVLPEPKYDSNSGFTLSLKARNYNLFGSLSPLKFDLGWETDEKERKSLGFLLDAELPFRAFGRDWNFTFSHNFKYYFNAPAYYKQALGLSVDFPLWFTVLRTGFEQGLVIHEENNTKDRIEDGDYHDWYLYSRIYGRWKIPTPLEAGPFGTVSYTPELYGNINYQPRGDVGEYRRGPSVGLIQRLGFDRIDWLGNFRQGLSAELTAAIDYNTACGDWDNSIGAGLQGHLRVSRLFGVSGRFTYTLWLDDSYDRGGDLIRGYRDDELDLTQRLSFNLDFPFRLIRFVPSEWFNNPRVRYFDFEQHWSPFIDILMADSSGSGYSFKPEDAVIALGLELITFPLAWRSFYLRISAGWDIREWVLRGRLPSGIHREIFIGLGHFY